MKNAPGGQKSLYDITKEKLRLYGLRARKHLGQHFLIDKSVLDTIIDVSALAKSDTVIEVGPGPGVMTGILAEKAGKVIAVELDDNLAAMLGVGGIWVKDE